MSKPIDLTKHVNTAGAAALLGVDPSRVRQLRLAGDLTGQLVGRDWWFLRRDVENLTRRQPGRPKSSNGKS